MENVTFIEVESMGVTETHAIIENENGGFTSMPKSVYDKMKLEQEAIKP